MKQGTLPSMDDVAREAMISRATAYRYFKSIDALLAEAPVDAAVGHLDTIFSGDASSDPETRIDQAEASMHKITFENEAHLRVMLASSLTRAVADEEVPLRQNRRVPLIESALAPARHRFRDDDYQRLCSALALIFGTESMIVCKDVIRIDEPTARQVKSWAVRTLVRAALQPSGGAPA